MRAQSAVLSLVPCKVWSRLDGSRLKQVTHLDRHLPPVIPYDVTIANSYPLPQGRLGLAAEQRTQGAKSSTHKVVERSRAESTAPTVHT